MSESFISSLFSSPKKPKPIQPPVAQGAPAQQAAADTQRARAMAQGRGSTVLTGGGLGNVG